MKAIETYYKGYRFRSRLEARWAVFFDACGAGWEYEPEGFVLNDGTCYLPDFLLHSVGGRMRGADLYVEVKGTYTKTDYEKIYKFAFDINFDINDVENPILVVGRIPEGDSLQDLTCYMDNFSKREYMDKLKKGCQDPLYYYLRTVDTDYFGGYLFASNNGISLDDENSNFDKAVNALRTIKAYNAAREA